MNAKGSDADPSENPQTPVRDGATLTPGDTGGKNAEITGAKEKSVEKTRTKETGNNPNKPAAKSSTGKEESKEPEGKKKKSEESSFSTQIAEYRQFLKEVYWEFRKISWPDRKQVIRETYSVIFLVTVITVMVLAFDFAVGKAVFEPLDKLGKHVRGAGSEHSLPPLPIPAPVRQPEGALPPAGESKPGNQEDKGAVSPTTAVPEGSTEATSGKTESKPVSSGATGQTPAPPEQEKTSR